MNKIIINFNKWLCKTFGHKIVILNTTFIDKKTRKWSVDYFVEECTRPGCDYKNLPKEIKIES